MSIMSNVLEISEEKSKKATTVSFHLFSDFIILSLTLTRVEPQLNIAPNPV